jgi:hypothetical protein
VGFYPVSPNTAFAGNVTVTGTITSAGVTSTGAITCTSLASSGNISTSSLGTVSASGGVSTGVGSLDVPQAGAGLKVAEGANAKQGTFTLTGGTTQAVPNTSVTANSRIFLTAQADGGTPGLIGVASRIPGTSFTVACVATDTSTYAYEIFEPG